MFVTVSHFHLSLIFAAMAGAYPRGEMPTNIRLVWKWLSVKNTVAYYGNCACRKFTV